MGSEIPTACEGPAAYGRAESSKMTFWSTRSGFRSWTAPLRDTSGVSHTACGEIGARLPLSIDALLETAALADALSIGALLETAAWADAGRAQKAPCAVMLSESAVDVGE